MVTRSRTAALVALTLVGLGGFVASAAVAPGDRVPAPVERVHRYYIEGPSADYEFDSGGIGEVRPVTWTVPEDGDQMAVVEVSFEYRTIGRGPFVVSMRVGDPDADPGDDGTGGQVAVRPDRLELAPAPRRTTTTVRFLVPALEAGQRYEARVGVNSVFPGGSARNLIRTRKVLVTVELTPR